VPPHSIITDSFGNPVDLISHVAERAAAIRGSVHGDDGNVVDERDVLRLEVRGVPVCSDFHRSASSHTGRQMEVDDERSSG